MQFSSILVGPDHKATANNMHAENSKLADNFIEAVLKPSNL